VDGLEDVTPRATPEIETSPESDFVAFFSDIEPRLRRALMAAYGFETGREATAEALAWAWEHWADLGDITNRLPYLFRVGQTRVRRRKLRVLHSRNEWAEPWVEPRLSHALRKLSAKQRVAVVLVHGYAWTMAEVGALLGIKVTTVQNHVERGLARLRNELEVNSDG
jgi:DNA-directed RNA polymerase specialized sigma24 family protein